MKEVLAGVVMLMVAGTILWHINTAKTQRVALEEVAARHETALGIIISVAKNDLVWQTENCGAVEYCWGPRTHDH